MSLSINTKRILFDEIKSNRDEISKILKKKRVGILKNEAILNENNIQVDDLFSEQLFLVNLSKSEHYTRKKTLRTFQKNLFEENYPSTKKLPSILKKQTTLKEILISTEKLKISIEGNKNKKDAYAITDLWSNKYYRNLLKHSKLDSLIKETEKEKIWRATKQRALINKSNSKGETQSILALSPILPHNIKDSNQKIILNIESNKRISENKQKKNEVKLPILDKTKIKEKGEGEGEGISLMNKKKKHSRKQRSVDRINFCKDAHSSLSSIISICDENKKDFRAFKEY